MSGRSYLDAEPWEGRFASAPRLRGLSVEDVLEFRLCKGYPGAKVRGLASRLPARATLLEVVPALVSSGVPDVDILWLAHHQEWFEAPDVVMRWLACDYAGMALPRFEARSPDDARPRQAIEVARRYAMGLATIDQLREARYAAAYAASDAAYAAYASSAYAAADAAAYAVSDADAAADAAYAYAAYAASAYAAYAAAARRRQVDRLLFVLRGGQ